MRRVLILGLVFSVFIAGLAPLSACALFSAKMAECAELTTKSLCDQMEPHSPGGQSFKESNTYCCTVAQAPLPELQFKAAAPGPAVTLALAQDIFTAPNATPHAPLHFTENASPPRFPSLLCTFLI